MTDILRIASTTIRNYGQSYEETLMRNQAVTALMVDEGRVVYNQGGDGFDWAVEYQRAPIVGNLGDEGVDYAATNRFMRAYLDYRGFLSNDLMSKREFLKNRGKQALIKYFSDMGEMLYDDMGRKMAAQWWLDGNASGNGYFLHGIESFMGGTQTVNSSTGALRTANAADYVLAPSDSYAGINTDLAGYGGSVTGVWPNNFSGDGSADTYDFFSPVLVNWSSSSFTGTTWAQNATDALRFLISACQKDSSPKGSLDLILLTPDLYRQYKTKNDTYQRINVENTRLRQLGFKDTIMLDGVEVKAEFGIAANIGYGLNIKQMELRCMQDRLFVADGPRWHDQSRSYRIVVDFMGNLKCTSPKFFGKLKNFV